MFRNMELKKITKKTSVDNKDIQYLGIKNDLIAMIEKQSEKYDQADFIILRDAEKDEIGLYSFETKLPEIKVPFIFTNDLGTDRDLNK